MKKELFIMILTGLLMLMPIALAQEISEPVVTPEQPVSYAIDKLKDNIQLFLTFDKFKKEELKTKIMEKRSSVVENMLLKNKTVEAEKALKDYEKIKLDTTKLTAEQKVMITENIQKHLLVLQGVRAKLEEKGIDLKGIDNAIASSSRVLNETKTGLSTEQRAEVENIEKMKDISQIEQKIGSRR